jgi:hypothetical protein
VDFLRPEISPEEPGPTAKSNDSLVVRLRYGERGILLPGDAEKEVEYAMMAEDGAEALVEDRASWEQEFVDAGISGGSRSAGGGYFGGENRIRMGILVQCCCRDWKKAGCGCCERTGKARWVLTDGRDLRVSC